MNPILKFAKGGLSELFIAPTDMLETSKGEYSESATSTTKNSSSESSKSEKVGLKDLLSLAKELKGLPIDSDIVTKQIYSIYNNMDLYADGELDTSQLVSAYLQTLRNVRQAQFNQEQYNEAKKQALDKDGLGEIAVDKYGNVFVQDKETGNMGRMSIEEYKQLDKNKYEILTNSNLLYYRANSPEFAFKNDILGIVENGIGISKITEHLLQVASNLGTNSVRDARYQTPQSEEISEGLRVLQEAEKKNIKLDELSSNQKAQAEYALKYLWAALPENEKTVLKYKSDGTEKGATDLIQTLIFSRTSQKDSANESASGKGNGSGSGSSSGSSSGKGDTNDKTNWYTGVQNAENGTDGVFQLNTGTSNSLMVNGTVYGNIKDSDWKPIGNASMTEVMNGGLSGIVKNMYGISFGDKVIDPEDLNDIMYDNGGGIVIPLPTKIVKGTKVVDLSIINEYNEAYSEYKKQKGSEDNPELFGKILEEHGLTELLDDNGLPDRQRFCNFLVVSGYAVDKKNKFYKNTDGQDNDFIEDVDADDSLIDLIQSTLSTDSKKSNYKIDKGNWYETESPESWWNTYDHIYRGNLYIPLSDNENSGLTAGKAELPYYLQHEHEAQYQIREKRKSASSITGADVLNL